MAAIHISDIEAAINHWRAKKPSPDGFSLAPELRALAEVYGAMVWQQQAEIAVPAMPESALNAWLTWYQTTPDTPCIAICSTSQGDEVCKGCGRTFNEVQHWLAFAPWHKRAVWQRITHEASAWRFGRYADRAVENARSNKA